MHPNWKSLGTFSKHHKTSQGFVFDCFHSIQGICPTCAGRVSKRRVKLDSLPESRTVKTLLDLMSRGNTHISTAAEVARAMQHDGLTNEPLKAFTSCGASGASPQNTERDFHKWMRGAWGVELEPYYIKLNLEEPHL